MKYESELIKEIVDSRGHQKSSIHYESECVETWVNEAKGAYPKLCDYQSEWLEYISILDDTGGGEDTEPPIGEFPYETVTANNTATVNHVVPLAYKSAILKGDTLVNVVSEQGFGGTPTLYESRFSDKPFQKGETFTVFVVNPNVTTIKVGIFREDSGVWEREIVYDVSINKKINCNVPIKTIVKYVGVDVNTANDASGFENSLVIVSGDKSNLEIENYFEGMQSVEMPVLKTTNEDGTKTNILTVNEDVTLRGIGDVRDELNLLNGELTQNIGEAVLSTFDSYGGSTNNGIYLMAKSKVANDIPPRQTLIIDANKFIRQIQSESGQNIQVHVSPKEDGTFPTRDELREYLSQNPLTLYYIPTTSTVKTVELSVVNQDGEPLSKIKPIEGTMHIEVSGTPINPTAVLEVPVEAITQNLASFINEE